MNNKIIIAETEKEGYRVNDHHRKVKSLLKVLKESYELSKHLLMASQNNINQRHCKTIASKQVSTLKLMHKNNEEMNEVKCLSRFIVNNKMIDLSHDIFKIEQSGKFIVIHIKMNIRYFHHFIQICHC